MPYCSKAIQVRSSIEHSIEDIVYNLAIDEFGAEKAHQLDSYQFNIDRGLNDVRASVDYERQLIRLFCRYEEDLTKTAEKIERFVMNHSKICSIEYVDSKGQIEGS